MQYEMQFIKHDYAGAVVEQRAMDGYINATAMCTVAGKQWGHYQENKTTKAFIAELSSDIGIPISELIQSVRGGFAQGTWVHPQVAIHLAQWLSPKFAVQVTKWVYDWISGANAPQQKVTPAFVQRYHANSALVEAGHFSVINELFIRFYGRLESVGYILKDRGIAGREIRPDVSVGQLFSKWLSAIGRKGLRTSSSTGTNFPITTLYRLASIETACSQTLLNSWKRSGFRNIHRDI